MTTSQERPRSSTEARDNAIGLGFIAVLLLLAVLALGLAPVLL